ncbi:S-adenosyl-L-methionine-dependent methyltransferase [Roridomyces roridus]|uniref:rRNA adenine N(6)-methyltransferase n=1 Tax=Roridomyces roridus TaxID=1738132 RepID=A0AAD7CF97_9AGAR|nr:S-adenosyl-L-methionine-dependent methyltransferase [Roridomyces roridus]
MLVLVSRSTRRREVGAFARRFYATGKKTTSEAKLPPRSLWRQHFPSGLKAFQHRVSIANLATAEKVAQAFVPKGSQDKTVIEIFPGPGQLTRALLALPRSRIKKLIVMENAEMYLKYLKPLEAVDDRITVLPIGGESWTSYQQLEELRLLEHIQTVPWDQGVHPQLQFISHLTSNIPGEQLISQLIRSIPDQQWLFKYGRVPMGILLSEYIWKRIVGDTTAVRCKLSNMAAATTAFSEAVPYSMLQPYTDHFHPIPSAINLAEREKEQKLARPLMTGKAGNPFVAANFTPLEHQLIKPGLLHKWDYCLRHLYVNRAQPLKNALVYLAPNAQSLLKVINAPGLEPHQRVDPKTPVRQMSMNDWALLVKAFDEWPFAPEDLSITDAIGGHEEKKG